MAKDIMNEMPSKKRVNRAGDNIRNARLSNGLVSLLDEDVRVVDQWRKAHGEVINTFQVILRQRARGTDIVVVQRHKRRATIYDKLIRYPKMQLARMDDIAGVRIIFDSTDALYDFRRTFLETSRFNHRHINGGQLDKYDYVKTPKTSGYRGVHDIFEYQGNRDECNGLRIEVQYRTRIQHAWATAVEIAGVNNVLTAPKFGRSSPELQRALLLASEMLARAHENEVGALEHMENEQLIREFLTLEEKTGLFKRLQPPQSVQKSIFGDDENGTLKKLTEVNRILILEDGGKSLTIEPFSNMTSALKRLYGLEEELPDADIVLVSADADKDVELAFQNYFMDSAYFRLLIENSYESLRPRKSLPDLRISSSKEFKVRFRK